MVCLKLINKTITYNRDATKNRRNGTWNKKSVKSQWPMEPITFSFRCINTFSTILFSILFGIWIFLGFVVCIYFHTLASFRPTSQKHFIAERQFHTFGRHRTTKQRYLWRKKKLSLADQFQWNYSLCCATKRKPRKIIYICWLCVWCLMLYCKTFSSFRNVGCAVHISIFFMFYQHVSDFICIYVFVALVIFAYFLFFLLHRIQRI